MKILFIVRESSKSHRGGDIVQIEKTAEYLSKLNYEIYITDSVDDIANYNADIIHFTGINLQINLQKVIDKFSTLEARPLLVLSTIFASYEDYERNVRKNFIIKYILKFFGYKKLEFLKEMVRNKDFRLNNFIYFFFKNEDYIYDKYLKYVNLFLPNSNLEKEALLNNFSIESDLVKVVNNGVDFNDFKQPEPIPFKDFVLCVARIEGLKNQINLVKACKKINKNLILIGNLSKSQSKYYASLFKELDEKRIYIGEVNHKDLSTYYNKCNVHALVSYFETCGLTSLEAVSFNKNIVVSDVGFVRDYFADNVSYCNPHDVDSIAEAILEAESKIQNIDFTNKVIKNYSWEKAAEQTSYAYNIAQKGLK